MKNLGSALGATLMLLASATSAFAGDKLYTVAGFSDGDATKGAGFIDADGNRYFIKDDFFSEAVGNEVPVTIDATLGSDGKTLDVKWIQATTTKALKAADGTKIKAGTELHLVGRRDTPHTDPEAGLRDWKVVLPDGNKVWVEDDLPGIKISPDDPPVDNEQVRGIVSKTSSGDIVITDTDGKKTKVVGANAAVLEDAVGRWVTAYGVSYTKSGTFEAASIQAFADGKITIKKLNSKTTQKTWAYDRIEIVKPGKKGTYVVDANWGSDVLNSQGTVKKSDVVLGEKWVDVEGVVSKLTVDGEDQYTITKGLDTYVVGYGTDSGLSDDLLASVMGQTVKVSGTIGAGDIDHASLELRSLDSVITADVPKSKSSPAIAKGTAVRLIGEETDIGTIEPLAKVILADGTVALIPRASAAVAPSPTTGITNAVTGAVIH